MFKPRIQSADRKGFENWIEFVKSHISLFEDTTVKQSTNDLVDCYEHALAVRGMYVDLCRDVASKTEGVFHIAPLKHCFRAFEKTALRPKDKRYKCDNVYNVVRGALVYCNMAGVLSAVQALVDSKDFVVDRIKDRFSPGNETSGGWRDVVVNGYLKSDTTYMHRVEIQVHHQNLLTIRKDLGGHYIYAKFRSLLEVLEVTFGLEGTREYLSSDRLQKERVERERVEKERLEKDRVVEKKKFCMERTKELANECNKTSTDVVIVQRLLGESADPAWQNPNDVSDSRMSRVFC